MPKRPTGSAKKTSGDAEDDLSYQRASWRVQRIGWVLMGLFIVLGLLGAFGDGPLSRVRAGRPGGLELAYSRVWRLGTESSIELRVAPDSGHVVLWVGRALLDGAEIRYRSPEPVRTQTDAGGQLLEFQAGNSGPVVIRLGAVPTRLGPLRTSLATATSPAVPLNVFVIP